MNIGALDLNLLLTLDVLLAELNVTRAAQRLNLSQPSVSAQLARLRSIFNDPLLLPGPRGMLPTSRAEALREPLRLALESLQRAIAPPQAFEPDKANLTWRIAATDYMSSAIMLPVIGTLRVAAPDCRVAVFGLNPPLVAQQLEKAELDLIFHTGDRAPETLHQRKLFSERYMLAGRIGHPHLHPGLTLDTFCQLEHLIVSPDGGGFSAATDSALARIGRARRVVLSVPHFLFMLEVLASSDMVAVLPERLVRRSTQLQVIEPPLDVPGFDILMMWHERMQRDPAHQWLRQQIMAAV
ncbi:LysR family transcriptional regulator [Pantoea phytobeneficialis]|uniref:LysR family transcriptional regulator n=1 Tax=Pantoea phytobeneficialis TaxID=2052056 RepID=A0AAP9H2Y6_9GAMM|nr:LysR family transcriptional regulator [Pantoea phytobeneficialis]MDO6409693.1 LysR family transcriptional regulator [Pantoea phytobeneficialis]QGR05409.1 LysR family transcriptional regulator [Pantoea phytobeneficialis]